MRTNSMTIEPDDRPGHAPTLFACFLHFDLSFMLWVLLGALGILIAEDLRLSACPAGPAGGAAAIERLAPANPTRTAQRSVGGPPRRRIDAGVPLPAALNRLALPVVPGR